MLFRSYAAYGGGVAVPPPAASGSRRDGYMPARTSSPPPGAGHSNHPSVSSSRGHVARESAGSFEPLLGGGNRSGGPSPPVTPGSMTAGNLPPPVVPPKNPARPAADSRPTTTSTEGPANKSEVSSVYSGEDDVVPDLTSQPKLEVSGNSILGQLKGCSSMLISDSKLTTRGYIPRSITSTVTKVANDLDRCSFVHVTRYIFAR